MTRTRKLTVLLLVAALCLSAAGAAVWAFQLGDLLKVGGIAFLVSQYGDRIDSFITSALGQRNVAIQGATKVVPILSLGRGGYIGAAQVVGNPDQVRTVKAVFQLEGRIGSFRPRVLVPSTTDRATGSVERVKGVGVSAVIEFAI